MPDLKHSRIVTLARTGGASFSAYRANRNDYSGLASPVMGFDDYRLSSDVFGPHQHRHMSALSYIFDDSGAYHNQDSMGTDLTITTGSLLWTWAGSGVTHHEFPEHESDQIHGLQLFLDIPVATRNQPPQSIYIPAEKMPVLATDGLRIKLVMGTAAGMTNEVKTPEDITFIDIMMKTGTNFQHPLPTGWNGMLYLLSGSVMIDTAAGNFDLNDNDTIALGAAAQEELIRLTAKADSHILFISGAPVV